jgi:hypothetical protein
MERMLICCDMITKYVARQLLNKEVLLGNEYMPQQ